MTGTGPPIGEGISSQVIEDRADTAGYHGGNGRPPRPEIRSRSGDIGVSHNPIPHAAHVGKEGLDFVFGELGFTRENRVSHDPAQIRHSADIVHPRHSHDSEDQPQSSNNTAIASKLSVQASTDGSESTEKPDEGEANAQLPDEDKDEEGIYSSNHYNPQNDVLLRLETMSAKEVRLLNLSLWIWLLVALAFLLWLLIEKFKDPFGAVRNYAYVNVNVAIGAMCFLAVTGALIAHCLRIGVNLKKDWRRRRALACALVTVELVAQWVNLAFYLIPNIYQYKFPCMIISPNFMTYCAGIRWQSWNILFLIALIQAHNSNLVSQDFERKVKDKVQVLKGMRVAVADLPFWKMHWWKIVIWFCLEGSIAGMGYYVIHKFKQPGSRPAGICYDHQPFFKCGIGTEALLVTSIMLLLIVLYFVLYCFYLFRAMRQMRANSSVEFKLANTIVRIQLRLRFPAFAVFMLSMLLLWYVRPSSCNSIFNTWLGLLPSQMAGSIMVICSSFVASPKYSQAKGRPPVLQVWLQEYAWTEKEKPARLATRNGSMALEDREEIEREPMFCMETMMICFYWSLLIYDFQEIDDGRISIEEACDMFEPALDQYEMFWEKSLDTKCLLAWNRETIVLCFRGTASLSNVKADVQAWRTPHKPVRGSYFRHPKVHSGFDKAWRNNGLNDRVVEKIRQLFTSGSVDLDTCRILVTGHSLGGACSILAAYEICEAGKECGFHGRVSCYTFGAPRVGDHLFVRDFNALVTDCWNIINDQDIVARGAKFFLLYKRTAHRVLINRLGDLLVRPRPIEASLRLMPCSGSVQQHLLSSYAQSIVSILVSQFRPTEGSRSNMMSVLRLVKSQATFQKLLLEEVGLSLRDLQVAYRNGGSTSLIARAKKNAMRNAKKASYRQSPEDAHAGTTRGNLSCAACSCCSSVSIWVSPDKDETNVGSEIDLSDLDENVGDTTARPENVMAVPETSLAANEDPIMRR